MLQVVPGDLIAVHQWVFTLTSVCGLGGPPVLMPLLFYAAEHAHAHVCGLLACLLLCALPCGVFRVLSLFHALAV